MEAGRVSKIIWTRYRECEPKIIARDCDKFDCHSLYVLKLFCLVCIYLCVCNSRQAFHHLVQCSNWIYAVHVRYLQAQVKYIILSWLARMLSVRNRLYSMDLYMKMCCAVTLCAANKKKTLIVCRTLLHWI